MTNTFEIIERRPEDPTGWLQGKLPKSVMEKLQSYIEEAKKNPVNHNKVLAGNISLSLKMKDKNNWFLNTILTEFIKHFSVFYPTYIDGISIFTEHAPYCLESFWVNFQKQNEFNPYHNHGGVFSFVIFVKIPTDWREQHALPVSANSNSPCASDFEFQYTTMLGQLNKIAYPLDKNSEGTMLFFPSKLNHQVYPFYNCDKERVSISGNIVFDISENSMKQYRETI